MVGFCGNRAPPRTIAAISREVMQDAVEIGFRHV
jgi:hypothetical protein